MQKLIALVLLGLSCAFAIAEDDDVIAIHQIEPGTDCDKKTRKGDLVRITFNGTIGDKTGFFSTRYYTEPLEFVLGDGEMIPGFDAGLVDMCPGELRYMHVPHKYAYEENGMGGEVPSRVGLYFYVRLLSLEALPRHKAPRVNAFEKIDEDGDKLISRDEVHTYLKKGGIKDVDGDGGLKQITRDIFKEEDRNANGFIDHNEFSGIKREEL